MQNKFYLYHDDREVTAYPSISDFLAYLEGDYRDNIPSWVFMATEFNSEGNATHYDADELQERYNEWRAA